MARVGRYGLAVGIAAVCVAVVLAISGGSERPGAPERALAGPPPAPDVDCETRSQVVPPRNPGIDPDTERRSLEVAGVTFYGARIWRNESRKMFRPRKNGRPAVVKMPVAVPAGPPATLTLDSRNSQHATYSIGLDGRPYEFLADEVTLEPCPPDHEVAGRPVGDMTPFLGGYEVTKPQCLRFTVTRGDETEQGRIALGRGTC